MYSKKLKVGQYILAFQIIKNKLSMFIGSQCHKKAVTTFAGINEINKLEMLCNRLQGNNGNDSRRVRLGNLEFDTVESYDYGEFGDMSLIVGSILVYTLANPNEKLFDIPFDVKERDELKKIIDELKKQCGTRRESEREQKKRIEQRYKPNYKVVSDDWKYKQLETNGTKPKGYYNEIRLPGRKIIIQSDIEDQKVLIYMENNEETENNVVILNYSHQFVLALSSMLLSTTSQLNNWSQTISMSEYGIEISVDTEGNKFNIELSDEEKERVVLSLINATRCIINQRRECGLEDIVVHTKKTKDNYDRPTSYFNEKIEYKLEYKPLKSMESEMVYIDGEYIRFANGGKKISTQTFEDMFHTICYIIDDNEEHSITYSINDSINNRTVSYAISKQFDNVILKEVGGEQAIIIPFGHFLIMREIAEEGKKRKWKNQLMNNGIEY